ncbi:unnamed protein product, partial [Scytosiphon promiscuus]
RLAAKELAGVFNFSHKAFVKMLSRRGGGASSSSTGLEAGGGGEKDDAANAAAVAAGTGGGEEGGLAEDLRHLGVGLLCAFMDSDDAALQMQMVTGSRGGGPLGLIFRGSLWRDTEETCMIAVETLHKRLLLNRRVSRRAKADFFSVGTIEHLRKVFDDASPRLYEALRALMSAVLCDPITSPFLEATAGAATSAATGDGQDRAVVTWQRPLLGGLACLGAHEDLGQRALLLTTLGTCPSLLGPYLRTLNAAMLEARPTYHLLQTYSLVSVLLREVPVACSLSTGEDGGGGGGSNAGHALMSTVMPTALNKKELTRGVLSGNSLLQALTSLLRQRMPEWRLLSLLDRYARTEHDAAENTPLGMVLRREDPGYEKDGGEEGDAAAAAAAVVEGEAGVWLDVLAANPGAIGVLVVLARSACDNAHALMAAGIRAAERGMKGNGFRIVCLVRPSAGWPMPSRTRFSSGDFRVRGVSSLALGVSFEARGCSSSHDETQKFSMQPGPPTRRNISCRSSTSLRRSSLVTTAVSRVLHLHDDPRPFAAMCLAGGEDDDGDAADGGGSADGSSVGGVAEGRALPAPAAEACEGLAVSIARLFHGTAEISGVGDRSTGNTAAALLLKKRPPPRPAAIAASSARLAAALADNPGLSIFELERLELLLSPPCLPLPRLIDDSFAVVVRGSGGEDNDDDCAPEGSGRPLLPCSNGSGAAEGREGEAEKEALLLSTGLQLAAVAAHDALSDVFRRPFLLRVACPLPSERTGRRTKLALSGTARSAGNGCSRSLGEVACTDMAALVVAGAAAEEEAGGIARGGGGRGRRRVVADATGPFLERLCRAIADAVSSGSPDLRWLSQALIACRGCCSSEALSGVLEALLSRLTAKAPRIKGSPGGAENEHSRDGPGGLTRRLLEQLLAPSSRTGSVVRIKSGKRDGGDHKGAGVAGRSNAAGRGAVAAARGGEATLVRKLRPEAMEALMRLQVESPSPDLGWLVCLALTGSSRDGSTQDSGDGGNDGVGGDPGAEKAAAGLLDDEAFFRHFFVQLTGGGGGGGGDVAADGDGADARILEELVRSSHNHASRFASAMAPILRDLPPLTEETVRGHTPGGDTISSDGCGGNNKLSMAQATGTVRGAALGSSDASPSPTTATRKRRRFGEKAGGGGLPQDGREGGLGPEPGTGYDNRARFLAGGGGAGSGRGGEGMASASLPKSRGGKRKVNATEVEAAAARADVAELVEVLLPRCVVPLFEAAAGVKRDKGSEQRSGGVNGVGGAKGREMKKGSLACLKALLEVPGGSLERSASVALDALRRSMSACERSSKRPPPDARAHALACAALAAWLSSPSKTTPVAEATSLSGGRANPDEEARRAYLRYCLARSAIAARANGAATTPPSAARTALPAAVADEDDLCRFLLGEAARVVAEAGAQDGGDRGGGAIGGVGVPPRAKRLLGLGCDSNDNDLAVGSEAGGDAASVGAVDSFFTAVLKHRLTDAASLSAVRAAAAARPLLPGWSAATMLERVVGHSGFLGLLKLLVLLVSAGGVTASPVGGDDGGGEAAGDATAAAPHGAGAALVRPLLSVYRVSMSEGDQQIYDPCFVLPMLEWGLRGGGVKAQAVRFSCCFS